ANLGHGIGLSLSLCLQLEAPNFPIGHLLKITRQGLGVPARWKGMVKTLTVVVRCIKVTDSKNEIEALVKKKKGIPSVSWAESTSK
ncbi:unnamed protein product, partial [Chrysoparadoxa australica]